MEYHVLIARDNANAKWGVEFGDYDRGLVLMERYYLVESGYRAKNVRVVTINTDSQKAIDESVAALNLK
jgi:hypothetical protein